MTESWAAPAAAFAEHLPSAAGQRDVRTASQAVQRAGVPKTPHPRTVLLGPALVALTAVEQHRGTYGGTAAQVVRDDTAEMGQQRVAEVPAVRGHSRSADE